MGSVSANITPSNKPGAPASFHTGLRHRRQFLDDLWQQGIKGRQLLRRHTELIDRHLEQAFNDCPETANGFALLALGGYGRSELFPFSDIDIMLLYDPEVADHVDAVAEAIFYPLWDAGLEVGHGVRTLAACLDDADEDFFFRVSLLDSRLIAGSEALFTKLQAALERGYVAGKRPSFLATMLEHRCQRHQRFGQHSFMLEPHIKESRGGMRDIQAMLWTAKVMFGLEGTEALEQAGLLTTEERRRFDLARDWLIRIRNRLHYISDRKNDQLYFEYQEEMARAFEYSNDNDILAVERFMREVYGHMQTVAVTTDLFFEHVDDSLDLGRPQPDERLLEPGIELRRGHILLTDPTLLREKPWFMKLFARAARANAVIHYRTRRQIRANLERIDDRMRASRRMAKPFLDLLEQTQHPLPLLTTLLETGLLAAYLPEFKRIESLAQHDLYHVYTVDIHLLHTVAELHELREEMGSIYAVLDAPRILFLAGLLHDIGKGYGRGHAERGAEMAAVIGRRLGLDEQDIDSLRFLVRHHLFLSDTALRRDLEDGDFLLRCARRVQTPERLAMLYLLAVADARATGPSAWNEWKAALLLELYLRIGQRLDHLDHEIPDQQQGVTWMRDCIRRLLGDDRDIDLNALPDEYLLSFPPEAVAEQIRLSRQLGQKEDVIIRSAEQQGFWSLLIMTDDRPGLLSRICGVLALHNLRILGAQIFTLPDGTVVDSLDVISLVDQSYDMQDWQAMRRDIGRAVNHRVGLDRRISQKPVPLGQPVPMKVSRRPSQVIIDNDTSGRYTVVEVYADDRLGLLYQITRTLAAFNINIFRAKIGCRADQAVDVFYVQDYLGNKIEEPELQEEIRQELLFVVADAPEKQ